MVARFASGLLGFCGWDVTEPWHVGVKRSCKGILGGVKGYNTHDISRPSGRLAKSRIDT